MGKQILTCANIEIEIGKIYRHIYPSFLENINIDKIVFNKISCGNKNYKHFYAYLFDDYKVKPFRIIL